ncbi:MAG TPA: peroxiredoxin [Acidobacteriota bacterium]|nr:peroxiredoxin [Acidobacteriota bacterium]
MIGYRQLLGITVFCVLVAVASAADESAVSVKVGDRAPSFSAVDADGNTWNSADHVGKKYLVVYFYPAAMTGGCTKQACSYRDDLSQLRQAGAEIVGISGDEVENLKAFREVERLNFTLLSDKDGSIARKFGVPVKEGGSIRRAIDGQERDFTRGVTTSRWTFIIDKEGKIAYVNSQVDAANDSKAVLAALEDLKN